MSNHGEHYNILVRDMTFAFPPSQEACHNYVRVLAKKSDGELFVCGTNSYNPKCRSYRKEPVSVFCSCLGRRNSREGRGVM